ncbi:ABC transporter ATP-binding protein [Labrys sp. LIt4]|uniref:ABC transporter ATP-binding protein n=1 Tax=Labrys sp. LIt4 TaxID=2821355 RepID=UPI001AE059B4|nr:ABC transporter ATP-binding protein [Labrys sp. LIt4]MBP0582809.1 ABC transporter ATP-binding protein [Labrys sp. LIt4]
MANLSLQGVRKSFGSVDVLHNIDIELDDGGFLVLLGPSGCGKSTLLSIIAGLEPASGGDVVIGGRRMNDVYPKDRNIAMVFQSYALYPTMSVGRNIGFGLEMRGVGQAERNAAIDKAASLLQVKHLLDRKPGQLSGGQRQRVAMGRAIVRNPELFLFDEPLSNLDAQLRVEMRTEIKRLHNTLGTTIVYVTHDQVEAMTLGTLVAVMKDGVIQQLADPRTIYDRPANMFVAGFIGSPSMNFVEATIALENGRATIRLCDGQVLDILVADAEKTGFDGKSVIVGIRPEALTSGSVPGATLKGRVDVVEPTGPDTMVIVDVGGKKLTARLGARESPTLGEQISLSVDLAGISLFDPATGQRWQFPK